MTALEMLMMWRYRNPYGVHEPGHAQAGQNRAAHTAQVQAAYQRNRGYSLSSLETEYQLRQVALDGTLATWTTRLTTYPILLGGNYGMSRPARASGISAGHYILAIGISNSNKVVYLDPFFSGWARANDYRYLTIADAWSRLDKNQFNIADAWTTRTLP